MMIIPWIRYDMIIKSYVLCLAYPYVVSRLSTKIVQIDDKSMKRCHSTYDP